MKVTAVATLYLACKLCELQISLRALMLSYYFNVMARRVRVTETYFTDYQSVRRSSIARFFFLINNFRCGQKLDCWKNWIVAIELEILYEFGYQVEVEVPHPLLAVYAKELVPKSEPTLLPKLIAMSWSFLNDIMRTHCAATMTSNVLASSAIYIASRHLGVALPEAEGEEWWLVFDVERASIATVAGALEELYKWGTSEDLPCFSLDKKDGCGNSFWDPARCPFLAQVHTEG